MSLWMHAGSPLHASLCPCSTLAPSLPSLLSPLPQVFQWTSKWSWQIRGHSSRGAAPSQECRSPTSSSRSPTWRNWSQRPTTVLGLVRRHLCLDGEWMEVLSSMQQCNLTCPVHNISIIVKFSFLTLYCASWFCVWEFSRPRCTIRGFRWTDRLFFCTTPGASEKWK